MKTPPINANQPAAYRSFEDLEVYKAAREFRKAIYLPPDEVGNLKSTGWHLLKLTNGYLRCLRDCKMGVSLGLREGAPAYCASNDNESLEWLEELLAQHPDLLPPPR